MKTVENILVVVVTSILAAVIFVFLYSMKDYQGSRPVVVKTTRATPSHHPGYTVVTNGVKFSVRYPNGGRGFEYDTFREAEEMAECLYRESVKPPQVWREVGEVEFSPTASAAMSWNVRTATSVETE